MTIDEFREAIQAAAKENGQWAVIWAVMQTMKPICEAAEVAARKDRPSYDIDDYSPSTYRGSSGYFWCNPAKRRVDCTEDLPSELFQHLEGGHLEGRMRNYPTRREAMRALRQAFAKWEAMKS